MGSHAWVPSTLPGRVSDLGRVFELCGCTTAWDDAGQRGNPVKSHQVTETVERYARQARERGYAQQGAPPLTPGGLSAIPGETASRGAAAVRARLKLTALVHACTLRP